MTGSRPLLAIQFASPAMRCQPLIDDSLKFFDRRVRFPKSVNQIWQAACKVFVKRAIALLQPWNQPYLVVGSADSLERGFHTCVVVSRWACCQCCQIFARQRVTRVLARTILLKRRNLNLVRHVSAVPYPEKLATLATG